VIYGYKSKENISNYSNLLLVLMKSRRDLVSSSEQSR